MNKDLQNQPLPEPPESGSEIDKKIAALRQRLATDATAWPQSANALLTDLAASSDGMEDDAMLVMIVQDALHGVDVPRKYPEAYRRILSNGSLRQIFLDLLVALDPSQEKVPPNLPTPDLSFLYTAVSPQPTIHHSPSGWHASWHLLSNYLTNQFLTPLMPAYRSGYDNLLEEQSVVLLEDAYTIADLQLNVLLEINLDVNNPETPALFLSVSSNSGQQPPMQASLTWGGYQATAVLDHYGQATFPTLPISEILDKTGQAISTDLHFVLELAPA